MRNGKLPINKAVWPISAKLKMNPIPESAPSTITPESVMLATGGGTIHDMLRAQRSDYNASRESQRLAPLLATYADDEDCREHEDTIMEEEEPELNEEELNDELLLGPPPGYDTDASSD